MCKNPVLNALDCIFPFWVNYDAKSRLEREIQTVFYVFYFEKSSHWSMYLFFFIYVFF